ncbi:MAG: zinc-dependent alcohol dehydrogenase family protein [Gammaproteobacteria bacterium]|nr:zinc-dependent alcohol dehydrogenase family protein [Gammaproteobacteria bacterium]
MTSVVRFFEYGPPEVLKIVDEAIAAPGPGEMRVRVEAIGLNRAEAAFRSGQYIEKAVLPSRLGYEAAGRVLELGPQVHGFGVGDAVCIIPGFSMNEYSVYAEETVVPAAAVFGRPPGLDHLQAAALWMAYLTAYGALIDAVPVAPGEAVIITAASSSVGLAAIAIANRIGAVPIAVTRSEGKRAGLLQAGATHVVVSALEDVAAEVQRITGGKGARLAFDPVGGPAAVAQLVPALAVGGTLILYGNLSGQAHSTPFPFGPAVRRALSLRGYLVFEVIADAARLARARDFILAGYADGDFRPQIARVFPFAQIVEAHRYLESNQQLGKVVVEVDAARPDRGAAGR